MRHMYAAFAAVIVKRKIQLPKLAYIDKCLSIQICVCECVCELVCLAHNIESQIS